MVVVLLYLILWKLRHLISLMVALMAKDPILDPAPILVPS